MSWWMLLSFSCMLLHEMDAIRRREWRLFIWLRDLDDEAGYRWFCGLHLPLYLWLLWGISAGHVLIQQGFYLFCVIHVGLHWLFRRHPAYDFHHWLSRVWIGGAGVAGLAGLWIG